MKYYITAYGCQMNKSDSERIAAALEQIGYSPTLKEDKADILILVACSVRQSAVDRIYSKAKRWHKLKTKRSLITILTGCVLSSDKRKLVPYFDLILPISDLAKLSQKLTNLQTYKLTNYFKIHPRYQSNFQAFVPISTGCNNFCTYCIVPYTRGPEKSRPVEDIMAEVKNLIKRGYKEITLLGQNVNSYISRINTNLSTNNTNIREISDQIRGNSRIINFPKLLQLINDIPGKFWLRFITSHPKDLSDELIETMAKCEKVCEYLHLPVQSGDNEILKKMNRGYTVEYYKKIIRKIRAHNKNYVLDRAQKVCALVRDKTFKNNTLPIAISTDIIVGFPGETKEQFENTAKLMRQIKFDMAYIAQYSPRLGTAANKLEDNVPIKEKERRRKILTEILKKTALKNNQKYLGKTVEILIEEQKNNYFYGKTRTFKTVKILRPRRMDTFGYTDSDVPIRKAFGYRYSGAKKGPDLKIGQFAKVKISSTTPWGLEGIII